MLTHLSISVSFDFVEGGPCPRPVCALELRRLWISVKCLEWEWLSFCLSNRIRLATSCARRLAESEGRRNKIFTLKTSPSPHVINQETEGGVMLTSLIVSFNRDNLVIKLNTMESLGFVFARVNGQRRNKTLPGISDTNLIRAWNDN